MSTILKTILTWLAELLWGKLAKWLAEQKDKKENDKKVDDIVDKIESPDLKDQLDGVQDAEDRLNSNT